MRIDNLKRIINRQIWATPGSGLKGKRIKYVLGGIQFINDIQSIRFDDIENVTQESYIEEQKYEQMIDKTTGNSEISRGEGMGKRASATEASISASTGNFRVNLKVMHAQVEQALMYRHMWQVERTYGNPKKVIFAYGQDGSLLQEEGESLYQSDFEFRVVCGGFVGNRLLEQQAFIQGMNAIKGSNIIEEFDPRELARMVANLFPMSYPRYKLLKTPNAMGLGYLDDPMEENRKALLGLKINVLPGQAHGQHITVHNVFLNYPGIPEELRKEMAIHNEMHKTQLYQDQVTLGQVGGMKSSMMRQAGLTPQGSPNLDMQAVMANAASAPGGNTAGTMNNMAPNQEGVGY